MLRSLKPIFAILVVNLAVLLWITLIVILIKIFTWYDIFAATSGYWGLLLYSFVVWFASALISLLLSKFMVKFLYSIEIIDEDKYQQLKLASSSDPIAAKIVYLYERLQYLGQKHGVSNVELWIYDSAEPNAFATWCWICGRLIAFSSWILEIMDIDELDWVLGHEFAHLMNGDMVTTTILQGFLDTFIIFISRVIASIIVSRINDDEESSVEWSFLYGILTFILEFLFWIIVSLILAWYSRIREYAADKDSALKYSNKYNMINALKRLLEIEKVWVPVDPNNDAVATLKINNFAWKLMNLFATHPPLEDRIKRLQNL